MHPTALKEHGCVKVRMPLAIRAKFESNSEMLKNFDEALKHPNDKDVDSLMKCVNEAL